MIIRNAQLEVASLLQEYPAVGVLGPRQVGKTTMSRQIAASLNPSPVYLDLELPSDLAKLSDPESYFTLHAGRLLILDEIQRTPELFSVLRGVIDKRKSEGFRTAQFLVLGSASLDLLQQSSETLAGRIAYKEMTGFTLDEIGGVQGNLDKLWLRGGFPDSFLAATDEAAFRWRSYFISTYLEREVPRLGPRIPANMLRRLWMLLAHHQGGQINFAQLASSLDISATTAKRYVELLHDLMLVRVLMPWSGNFGKRLVKAPKVYIRDSGLTHALLQLVNMDDLLGHPVSGMSWEGFVIENLIACLPEGIEPWYYRTGAGAEIDLVIERNNRQVYAIEIKRSSAPKVSKGFHQGCLDMAATHKFVVYSGNDQFPLGNGVTAIGLAGMMAELKNMLR